MSGGFGSGGIGSGLGGNGLNIEGQVNNISIYTGPMGPQGPQGETGPSAFLEWNADMGDDNLIWSSSNDSCIISLTPYSDHRTIILGTDSVDTGHSVYVFRKHNSLFNLYIVQAIFGMIDVITNPGVSKFVFDGTRWHKW